MPSKDEVERSIKGDREDRKAAHAAREKSLSRAGGAAGRAVGNWVEKIRNAKGMIEADAKARRPQT